MSQYENYLLELDFFSTVLLLSIILLAGVYIYFKCRSRLLDYIIAIFVAAGASEILKYIIDRPRPVTVPAYEGSGFPSSHATIAFAVVFFLLLVCHTFTSSRARVGDKVAGGVVSFIVLITAIYISYLRVFIWAHYVSDVLAGIILALVIILPFRYYDIVGRKAK